MDLTFGVVLGVFFRWLHIASIVCLIGGFVYARFAVWPALATLGSQTAAFENRMIAGFRGFLYSVLAANLISGLYNFLTKPSYPPYYQMVIGVKFLFVLHIYAVTILYTLPTGDTAKRRRWLTGMVTTGLIIIALSAILRLLSLNALQH